MSNDDSGNVISDIASHFAPWGDYMLCPAGKVADRLGSKTEAVTKGLIDGVERVRFEIETRGGRQKAWGLTIQGLCTAAGRSRKPAAQELRRWAFSQLVPDVVVRGGYVTAEAVAAGVTIEDLASRERVPVVTAPAPAPAANVEPTATMIPGLSVAAVRSILASSIAAIDTLTEQLSTTTTERDQAVDVLQSLAPVAKAAKHLTDRRGMWLLRDAAKMLGIRPMRLREWMRAEGVLFAARGERGRYDAPAERHVEAGRLELRPGKPWTNQRTGDTELGNPVVLVTAKGLAWLAASLAAGRVLDDDAADVIERAENLIADTRALPAPKKEENNAQ